MQIYNVVIGPTAIDDMKHLRDFLVQMKSEEGAIGYLKAMQEEINSLKVFADCYRPSSSSVIKRFHKNARRIKSGAIYSTFMVSLLLWIESFPQR